jgi:CHASE2 domain-containing sensor protein
MTDEPSAAELSPEETYRSIGRYVYEFSQLVAQMRATMTRYLNTTPQAVAEYAFAQSGPDQIANAFFGMCRAATQLDVAEEKTAARLGVWVGEAIEMRNNVAHGDWWVGASVLGVQAVERSARDLDARSDALVTLINLVAEYGAVCLRQPPYSRGEHRVSDYIVMRAGEAVREGPKAIASPRVFYKPPPREQLAVATEAGLGAARAAGLEQSVAEAAPAVAPAAPEPEPMPEALVEPATPEPAAEPVAEPVSVAVLERTSTPAPRFRGRRTRARFGAARGSARARSGRRDKAPSQVLLSDSALPKWLTHQRIRRGVLVLAGVTAALLSVGAYSGNVFGSIEQDTIGTRFSIRGTERPPDNIVIVAIDNQTVGTGSMPLWPFPRSYEANVINRIHAGGAKAIGVDIQFTNQTDPTDDNDLIQAVSAAHGIVLATSDVDKGAATDVFGLTTSQLRSQLGAYAANAYIEPSAELTREAYSQNGLQTFAVRLEEQATHHSVPPSLFPGGSALVDYAGPTGTFKPVSFVNVCSIKGRCVVNVPQSYFRGKIVLIGVTASAIHDVHPTPVDPLMSGVEYWANALWSIERGNPLRDASGTLNLLIVVLMAFAMPLAVLWLRPGLVLVAVALAVAVVYLVAAQLTFNGNTILSVVYPLVGLTLGTVEATAADLWAERRQRRQLEVYKVAYERLPSAASAAFFISYRRDQSSWPARILRDELVRRFGEDQVFKDNDSIDAGQEWPERLDSAVRNASVVLVLIGPNWADARGHDGELRLENPEDWVRLEVEAALDHQQAAVVPVLVDGASMPAADVLPESLRPLTEHQAVALSVERWSADLEALIDSIQSGRIRDFLTKERAAAAAAGEGDG